MSVKIVSIERDDSIPVRELYAGVIAKIVRWSTTDSECVGKIVQRCYDGKLQELGTTRLWSASPIGDGYRVRVLPNKTLLEVNQ